MKARNKFIGKQWVISIVTAAVMLAGFTAYAAYTSLNSVKRVVSTQGGKGTAFSSNYLNLTTKETDVFSMKNISFPESAETVSFEINVCNYVHNTPSEVNENDIDYTLILSLLNTDGSANTENFNGLTVADKTTNYSFSNGVCEIENQTLAGKTKSVNTYTITVPKEFINKLNIKAAAEPTSNSYQYTDNNKLGRVFTFSVFNAASTTWTGSFTETTTEDFDGFNYIIKGQGKGKVTLEWDSDNLEISKIFLESNSITPTQTGTKKTFTLNVDSDSKNRYDIQFYKTELGNYTDMETVNNYVKFKFEEISAG